jgi:hypothetical protein
MGWFWQLIDELFSLFWFLLSFIDLFVFLLIIMGVLFLLEWLGILNKPKLICK